MNKQLIKLYKEEFDHWLNGGKLLVRINSLENWKRAPTDVFERGFVNFKLIINDKFVKLRKALCDGLVVELQPYDPKHGVWITVRR